MGSGVIKEKELRLALVCYGGVSLAVYMHGVTKEILKLARASMAYHSTPDQETRQKQRYIDVAVDHVDECDSEEVYFEILKMIGASLDLRVVVDVIAGASAGGINGVILARALAHNLAIDGLREFWLRQADVAECEVRQVTLERRLIVSHAIKDTIHSHGNWCLK